ncbi:hypothetical protein I5Q34_19325 [Streptomyces sp. AV19]|uniref:hypothetical protein n=1 Tax=Streptomyces sp. AV19 TaxID=2793068 RepID=UPI0018FEE8A1|nr:hypothetical protein [Streptomyces sp. AV19]MBH1936400.1 hypothetical protein [Streptomyces sp. AV19]MDG4532439.1 hypothetical protein [Streptomyces sp. AV19]
MRLRLPQERPAEPPTGYKIAYPVLSRDATGAGFTGVSLGGGAPYGALDDARCVYGRRHRPPARRCDCGFHCLHSLADALALTCAGQHRRAVVLEVGVLGSYIRYERGMRYARQRVRAVRIGSCACGRDAVRLADAGWGRPGWRVVAPDCGGCALGGVGVTLEEFERLVGDGVKVTAERSGAVPDRTLPELMAEASLLQARLDWFEGQLAKFVPRHEE